MNCPPIPQCLILPSTGGKPLLGVGALPGNRDHLLLPQRHQGRISSSCIDARLLSRWPKSRARTKASTGCGGCAAMLKNLVDDELVARGVVGGQKYL